MRGVRQSSDTSAPRLLLRVLAASSVLAARGCAAEFVLGAAQAQGYADKHGSTLDWTQGRGRILERTWLADVRRQANPSGSFWFRGAERGAGIGAECVQSECEAQRHAMRMTIAARRGEGEAYTYFLGPWCAALCALRARLCVCATMACFLQLGTAEGVRGSARVARDSTPGSIKAPSDPVHFSQRHGHSGLPGATTTATRRQARGGSLYSLHSALRCLELLPTRVNSAPAPATAALLDGTEFWNSTSASSPLKP